jgi:hypothetical protein
MRAQRLPAAAERRHRLARSNGEIASDLFLSVKTGSVHVSSILAKPGVTSRGEAAAAAYQLRPFECFPARKFRGLSSPPSVWLAARP